MTREWVVVVVCLLDAYIYRGKINMLERTPRLYHTSLARTCPSVYELWVGEIDEEGEGVTSQSASRPSRNQPGFIRQFRPLLQPFIRLTRCGVTPVPERGEWVFLLSRYLTMCFPISLTQGLRPGANAQPQVARRMCVMTRRAETRRGQAGGGMGMRDDDCAAVPVMSEPSN